MITYTQITDVEHCLICGDYIGKGHDPAICGRPQCRTVFDYECAFNKFAENDNQRGGYDVTPKEGE